MSQSSPEPRRTQKTTATNLSVDQENSVDGQNTLVDGQDEEARTPPSKEAQDIEYRYMTFDTEIPIKPVVPATSKVELPLCPNLKKYDNPFGWSLRRKNMMTYLSCSVNMTAAYAAGSYAYPADQLTAKWNISEVVYLTGITIFTAGFGIAPMVLAPFSEINGRRPVFITTGLLFVLMQLCCALTETFGGMLAARFLMGVGGSTFSTMVGGILADIWETKERNTAMVLFTGATLLGTGLGPLVSGFVAENLLWRWVFYIQLMTSGSLVVLVTIFFKETRGSIILSRRAKAVNRWYEKLEEAGAIGMEIATDNKAQTQPTDDQSPPDLEKGSFRCQRIRWKVKADEERASLAHMIAVSLYRPITMLFTEPVVFWFSLWLSFAWGILYLQFGSVPLVFEVNHGFSLQETGAVFTAMCVASIISTVINIYVEKWAVKHYPEKINGNPEGRLLFTCIQAALLPIGLFWFGWTCYSSIHWIVPTIAVGVATMGIFSIFLAVFNYSADVYHIYASSALAGIGICRNLLGGSFPLITKQMFRNLGFQTASSVLGGIALALTLVPWILVFYGPRIRARSKIARSFVDT